MSQTRRRGTTAIIAGMAVLTVAIGAFAYQASADSSSNTATGGSNAGLMAAETRPRPNPAPTVPAEERERIFGRFHRLAASRGVPGSGLGLAIVAQTAAGHNGHVLVEPRPDGGGPRIDSGSCALPAYVHEFL